MPPSAQLSVRRACVRSAHHHRGGQRERALTMGNVRAKVLADDDVPGGPVAFIKLLLDLRGDVLLDVVLLEQVDNGYARQDVEKLAYPLRRRTHQSGRRS